VKTNAGSLALIVDNNQNLGIQGTITRSATGNPMLALNDVASAVNRVSITNAAAGGSPIIAAAGSDAAIGIYIASKGSGQIVLNPNGQVALWASNASAVAVNYIQVSGAVTTAHPSISAAGTDPDVNLLLIPKGNGIVNVQGALSILSTVTNRLTNLQDVGGASTAMRVGNGTLAFYNVAPVARAGAITPPAATASTNVTPFGFTTAAQADALVTAVRAIQLALANVGLTS
jgi:hypothetical protein